MNGLATIGVLCSLLLTSGTISPIARGQQNAYAEVEGTLGARGVGVLKLTVPGNDEIAGVSLRISRDGKRFTIVASGSLPNSQHLYAVSYEERTTTVVAPVVADFGLTDASIVFPEPGTYWVRWGVRFEDPQVAGLTVDQEVVVAAPHPHDVAFVSRLGEPQFFQQLLGDEVLNRLTGKARDLTTDPDASTFRWSAVIRPVLASTTTVEPLEGEHKSAEAFRRWTETMFDLASELPDSTYAPYAAFYAGGGYVTYLCEVLYQDDVPSDAIRKDELFDKAEKALKLCVEHGDAYLRPRAILQQARLHAIIGAWDKAERLVDDVENGTAGRGTVSTLSDRLRRDIRKLKRDQQRREMEQESD